MALQVLQDEDSKLELIEQGATVPLEHIRDSEQKVRIETSDKGLETLLESLKKRGQIHEISLLREHDGTLTVINGHRRLKASRLGNLAALRANIYRVPAGREADRDVLVQQHLYAANSAEPLLAVERARLFDSLMQTFDWDPARVAACFEGETEETVTDTLKYLSIDERVLDVVAQNVEKFTTAHLQVIAEYASPSKRAWRMKPEEQMRVAKEIVDQVDKKAVRDPRKFEVRVRSVVNERRRAEEQRKAVTRAVQSDPVKALVKAVESVEVAVRSVRDVDLAAIADIDPADKGDVSKRLYDAIEGLTVFTEDRVAKLRVRSPVRQAVS